MDYGKYSINLRGTHALFDIKRKTSGPVPNILKGGFTTVRLAQEAIDGYEREKGKTNAKPNSSGSD